MGRNRDEALRLEAGAYPEGVPLMALSPAGPIAQLVRAAGS